jgi:hypothetical protein
MASLSAARLVALWEPASGAPAHQRLEPLVAALYPGEAIEEDTLGARNRRLLALKAALGGPPLEARLRCGRCATDNSFTVPADEILACPVPDPAARVDLRAGGRRLSFRLPRMGDLKAAASRPGQALAHIVAQCRVGGADGPVPAAVVARLAARFEALDPAGRIVVDLACAECRAALRASVDLAEFVAVAIDRAVDGLLRDVHLLASAYCWSEDAILALPPSRRRRYLAMIATSDPAARPVPAPRMLQA